MSHCTSLGSIVNDTVSGGGIGMWNFNEAGVVLETEDAMCNLFLCDSFHTPVPNAIPLFHCSSSSKMIIGLRTVPRGKCGSCPQDIHILISGNCVTLQDKRDFEDVIQPRMLDRKIILDSLCGP